MVVVRATVVVVLGARGVVVRPGSVVVERALVNDVDGGEAAVVGGVLVGDDAPAPAPGVAAPALDPRLDRARVAGAVWNPNTPASPATVADEKMRARFMSELS